MIANQWLGWWTFTHWKKSRKGRKFWFTTWATSSRHQKKAGHWVHAPAVIRSRDLISVQIHTVLFLCVSYRKLDSTCSNGPLYFYFSFHFLFQSKFMLFFLRLIFCQKLDSTWLNVQFFSLFVVSVPIHTVLICSVFIFVFSFFFCPNSYLPKFWF